MKRILIVGLIILAISSALLFAVPVFAHGGEDGGGTAADEAAWQRMYEACESGDWDAMAAAAEEVHGEGFSGMMGGDQDDMMGSGWGGMMGR
jgi:hypothetical protein